MKYLFLVLFSSLILSCDSSVASDNIIIDSDMTFSEAIAGTKAPQEVIDELELFEVEYYGFDGLLHRGQLVMHKDCVEDLKDIFAEIKRLKFPVEKCIPIVKYEWSDNASMEDNNTSGFNYRFVANTTRLSNHSYGRAIDINPFQNPAVYNDGSVAPKGAKYDINQEGTLSGNTFIVAELKKRGWTWGGDWTSLKDYQHLELTK